jgi:DNA end-binding protein Ku
MSGKWRPENYTDDYQHALMELIHKKIEAGGRTPAGAKAPSKREATKVIDLMSVLQKSIEHAGRGSASRKPAKVLAPKRVLKRAA